MNWWTDNGHVRIVDQLFLLVCFFVFLFSVLLFIIYYLLFVCLLEGEETNL